MFSFFRRRPAAVAPPPLIESGNDADLEAAITAVGRERVFAYARAAGWGDCAFPPQHVWWQIVRDLQAMPPTDS